MLSQRYFSKDQVQGFFEEPHSPSKDDLYITNKTLRNFDKERKRNNAKLAAGDILKYSVSELTTSDAKRVQSNPTVKKKKNSYADFTSPTCSPIDTVDALRAQLDKLLKINDSLNETSAKLLFSYIDVPALDKYKELISEIYKNPQQMRPCINKLKEFVEEFLDSNTKKTEKGAITDFLITDLYDFWCGLLDSVIPLYDPTQAKKSVLSPRQLITNIIEKKQDRLDEQFKELEKDRDNIERLYPDLKHSKSIQDKYIESKGDQYIGSADEYLESMADYNFKEFIFTEFCPCPEDELKALDGFLKADSEYIKLKISDFIKEFLKRETLDLDDFNQCFFKLLQSFSNHSRSETLTSATQEEKKADVTRRRLVPDDMKRENTISTKSHNERRPLEKSMWQMFTSWLKRIFCCCFGGGDDEEKLAPPRRRAPSAAPNLSTSSASTSTSGQLSRFLVITKNDPWPAAEPIQTLSPVYAKIFTETDEEDVALDQYENRNKPEGKPYQR